MSNQFQGKIAVFVSSTYEDMKDYRLAVDDSLRRMDLLVRRMEFFGSRPGRPRDVSLAEVRKSRVYIGLFGMRYGSIDGDTGLSMTHLEYLEAQRLGISSLIYLIDEERQPVLPKFVERGEGGEKLERLKSELRGRFTVGFFTTPEDLARRIAQDLPPLLQQLGVDVQPNILAQLVDSMARVDWLTDERWLFIRGELSSLCEAGAPDPILRGTTEFLLSGDRLTATYLLAKGAGLGMRESIDFTMEMEKILAKIVERGRRAIANSQSPPARA